MACECTIKMIDFHLKNTFLKKFNIFVELSHSNVVSYYFARKQNNYENIKHLNFKEKTNMYIGMELMDFNLDEILERVKNPPCQLIIDIML